ncbi:hypothetical protein JCM10207_000626 [Rhodosporidiobolus poonsookiae]
MSSPSYSFSLAPSRAAFHPLLLIHLHLTSPSAPSPTPACPLYLLLPTPPSLILDRYELHRLHRSGKLGAFDPPSQGRDSLRVEGEGDLEAPLHRVEEKEGGSGGWAAALVRLTPGGDDSGGKGKGKGKARDQDGKEEQWTVEVPLHARYLRPVEKRWGPDGERLSLVDVEVPWPWVFYACDERQQPDPSTAALKSCPPPPLPFNLTFPSLSASNLYYLPPSPSSPSSSSLPSCPPALPPPLTITLPTPVIEDMAFVEPVTLLAVWGCALWVGWKAFGTWRRFRREEREAREKKKDKEGKKE